MCAAGVLSRAGPAHPQTGEGEGDHQPRRLWVVLRNCSLVLVGAVWRTAVLSATRAAGGSWRGRTRRAGARASNCTRGRWREARRTEPSVGHHWTRITWRVVPVSSGRRRPHCCTLRTAHLGSVYRASAGVGGPDRRAAKARGLARSKSRVEMAAPDLAWLKEDGLLMATSVGSVGGDVSEMQEERDRGRQIRSFPSCNPLGLTPGKPPRRASCRPVRGHLHITSRWLAPNRV